MCGNTVNSRDLTLLSRHVAKSTLSNEIEMSWKTLRYKLAMSSSFSVIDKAVYFRLVDLIHCEVRTTDKKSMFSECRPLISTKTSLSLKSTLVA